MVHVVTAEQRACVCGGSLHGGTHYAVLHEILKKKISGARSVKQI